MQKYSFLMSVYYKEQPEFLREALESMVTQTAFPDEIVLVKDGALTEELDAIIDEYDRRCPGTFTIIQNEKNIGLGKSLNVGLARARNDLVARMDSDDISYPERCALQLAEFEKDPTLDICGTRIEVFIDDPNVIEYLSTVAETKEEIYKVGQRRAAFAHVSVMYKVSTLEKYGFYGDYRRAQDTDLFCRMIHGGCNTKNLKQVLVKVRKDKSMAGKRNSKESINCILAIRKNLWKIGYMSFFQYAKMWVSLKVRTIMPRKLFEKLYFILKKRTK